MTRFTGGCLCGAIRYEIEAQPFGGGACHCRDCQYVSGGAPAYVMSFPADAFRLTKGEPRAHWSATDTGGRAAREFCADCGTPLFARNAAYPQAIAVKVGSLDDPGLFKPAAHIWTGSAPAWHAIDHNLPTFPGNAG